MAIFKSVKISWNSPAFFDPDVVEKRNEYGGRDGRELAVGDGQRSDNHGMREEAEDGKRAKDENEARGDGRNGGGLGDQKGCPGVEKSVRAGHSHRERRHTRHRPAASSRPVRRRSARRRKTAASPTIHARNTSLAEPTACIICVGTRKIPLPMMVPTTTAEAWLTPRSRASCGSGGWRCAGRHWRSCSIREGKHLAVFAELSPSAGRRACRLAAPFSNAHKILKRRVRRARALRTQRKPKALTSGSILAVG